VRGKIKYRIKEILRKDGSSQFFCAGKNFFIWSIYCNKGPCLPGFRIPCYEDKKEAQNEIKKLKGKEIKKIIYSDSLDSS